MHWRTLEGNMSLMDWLIWTRIAAFTDLDTWNSLSEKYVAMLVRHLRSFYYQLFCFRKASRRTWKMTRECCVATGLETWRMWLRMLVFLIGHLCGNAMLETILGKGLLTSKILWNWLGERYIRAEYLTIPVFTWTKIWGFEKCFHNKLWSTA